MVRSCWAHAQPLLEDHPFFDVCNCLFNILSHYPPYLEPISSIHNLRTLHTVVRGTLIAWNSAKLIINFQLLNCEVGEAFYLNMGFSFCCHGLKLCFKYSWVKLMTCISGCVKWL